MVRRIKKFNSEENLHDQVCDYIRLQYPGVFFRSNDEDGRKRHPVEQARLKRRNSCRAWPDIQIVAPMYKDKLADFYGLFIELKKDGVKLVRDKDAKKILKGETELREKGDWWDRHVEEQAEVIQYLKLNGYCATFAVGFDAAKEVIDRYLADYKTQLENLSAEIEALAEGERE